jgi:hypothetical protein
MVALFYELNALRMRPVELQLRDFKEGQAFAVKREAILGKSLYKFLIQKV